LFSFLSSELISHLAYTKKVLQSKFCADAALNGFFCSEGKESIARTEKVAGCKKVTLK